jgi:hypothetical protein
VQVGLRDAGQGDRETHYERHEADARGDELVGDRSEGEVVVIGGHRGVLVQFDKLVCCLWQSVRYAVQSRHGGLA